MRTILSLSPHLLRLLNPEHAGSAISLLRRGASRKLKLSINARRGWTRTSGQPGRVAISRGKYLEALPELRRAVELSREAPEPLTQLGFPLARVGDRRHALETLVRMRYVLPYVPAYNFVMVYCGLGDEARALHYLQ
jgi:Flp pilus assembly protein TadD